MAKKQQQNDDAVFQGQPEQITTELDPHLQEIVLSARDGREISETFASDSQAGPVLVDVLAVLHDPHAGVPGLKVERTIGQVATGTVAVNEIESVKAHANVISLKRASALKPQLGASVPEIRGTKDDLDSLLTPGLDGIDGRGVIVGIVDYGCDFQHKNFCKDDGSTRLLSIWDQRATGTPPSGFSYGREMKRAQIDSALNSANPYQTLNYNPGVGQHGTHCMDIAAGNGNSTNRPGVAPKADLIFVHIDHSDQSEGDEEEQSFGNSKHLIEAVDYIFAAAAAVGKPAVVNISLGTNGGPHDGRTPAEIAFDTLLTKSGRAIVIAASNSWSDQIHASAKITQSSPKTIRWKIQPGDFTTNELEAWYSGQQNVMIRVTPPGTTQPLPAVSAGQTVPLKKGGSLIGRIYHRQNDPLNHDNQIDIVLYENAPAGVWKLEFSTTETAPVQIHSWIERDDNAPSSFDPADHDAKYTLGSISCANKTIAVGSYLSGEDNFPLSVFSSEGPTRDGRQKPEVSAPGQWLLQKGILAAKSGTQGSLRMSGTSMAAPHIAGAVALLLQVAPTLTSDQIRSAIQQACRSTSNGGWDGRYGFGRIDVYELISAQLQTGSPTATTSPASSEEQRLASFLASVAKSLDGSKSKVRISFEFEPAS